MVMVPEETVTFMREILEDKIQSVSDQISEKQPADINTGLDVYRKQLLHHLAALKDSGVH